MFLVLYGRWPCWRPSVRDQHGVSIQSSVHLGHDFLEYIFNNARLRNQTDLSLSEIVLGESYIISQISQARLNNVHDKIYSILIGLEWCSSRMRKKKRFKKNLLSLPQMIFFVFILSASNHTVFCFSFNSELICICEFLKS